jgi:fumarate hydratase subunit alpha
MTLAKRALLRPFGVWNEDQRVAKIERELLQKVNRLGIGAMGLGEGPTALDLHIEMAARHPASLPVGVVISCWALRHARATVSREGVVEIDKSG